MVSSPRILMGDRLIVNKIYDIVRRHYNYETDEVMKWFDARNNMLSGLKPRDMLKLGREKKLLRFLEESNF